MKRVVIIVPYLKAGGTERQALQIVSAAAAHGFEAKLIVIERIGELIDLAPNKETIFLDIAFTKRNIPQILFKLCMTLRDLKTDLVVSRAWNANVLTAVTAKIVVKPSVLFLSGNNTFTGRSKVRIFIEKLLFSNVSSFVTLCNSGTENFSQRYHIAPERIQTIYNGVDVERVRRLATVDPAAVDCSEEVQKVRIGFLGRLSHRKGMDVLLDAVELLLRDEEGLPPFEINVIGDGEERTFLENRVCSSSLSKHVYFHGAHSNPFPLLINNDIFAMPSRAEGFPNALLEAMALGLAPVAADCETGPAEIISNGENGFLFAVDDVHGLAVQLKLLMCDSLLRSKISEAAIKTIDDQFTLEKQMQGVFELFSRCVQG